MATDDMWKKPGKVSFKAKASAKGDRSSNESLQPFGWKAAHIILPSECAAAQTAKDAIQCFPWAKTNEGFEFWNDVHSRLTWLALEQQDDKAAPNEEEEGHFDDDLSF